MSELEQWCEIDGHEWIFSYFSYGLVLGPKTQETTKQCSYCKHTETSIYVPEDQQLSMYTQMAMPIFY